MSSYHGSVDSTSQGTITPPTQSPTPSLLRRSSPVSEDSEASTSGSTIYGVAGWPGKLLLKLGLAMLDAFDEPIIQWRLARMNFLIKSIKDDNTYEGDDPEVRKMFNDVIELSRQHAKEKYIFAKNKKTRALKVILLVIATGKTSLLVKCLLENPLIVVREILHEVLLCMHPKWTGLNSGRLKMHVKLLKFYLSVETTFRQGAHLAMPFIDFFRKVAEESEKGLKAVSEVGVLDALSVLYSSGFHPSTMPPNHDHQGQEHLKTLLVACDKLLTFMADKNCVHAIHALWPRRMPAPLTTSDVCAIRRRRRDAWKECYVSNESIVKERISSIKQLVTSLSITDGVSRSSTDVLDVYADLVELSSMEEIPAHVAGHATEILVGLLGNDFQLVTTLQAYGNTVDCCAGALGQLPKATEHRAAYLSLLDAFALGQILKSTPEPVEVTISPLPNCCPSLQHWHRVSLSSNSLIVIKDEIDHPLQLNTQDRSVQILSTLESRENRLRRKEEEMLLRLSRVRNARRQLQMQIVDIQKNNTAIE